MMRSGVILVELTKQGYQVLKMSYTSDSKDWVEGYWVYEHIKDFSKSDEIYVMCKTDPVQVHIFVHAQHRSD